MSQAINRSFSKGGAVKPKKVLIIQEHLPHYRVPFYERLHELLEAEDVNLELTFDPNTAPTLIPGSVKWATPLPIHWLNKAGWQPVIPLAFQADLVIAQQEVKYLAPFAILCERALTGRRFALWGHGRNFQAASQESVPERIKRHISRHVHWWFAYNHRSAEVVRDLGYPPGRITEVMNSLDTLRLRTEKGRVSPEELVRLKLQLGIHSDNIGVYTGGMYGGKRIKFLLDAAGRIRREIPDFHLLVIGSGPDSVLVQNVDCPWIHYIGPKDDEQKIPYWMISKVLLMPGAVGLVILDSFALGIPMVTTAVGTHGPEIDYLRNGENGLMVDDSDSGDDYAMAVVGLFQDSSRRADMAACAAQDAEKYSIENMAGRFAEGVLQALAASPYVGFPPLDFLRSRW